MRSMLAHTLAFLLSALLTGDCFAGPLDDALKLQQQVVSEKQAQTKIASDVEAQKRAFREVLQALHFEYFKQVRQSGLSLISPRVKIAEINAARKRAGNCCDISVTGEREGGMYVVSDNGTGLFAIDGYGLQSTSGTILDEAFEKTGRLSSGCKYEVSISYKNSRVYDCSAFLSRHLDSKVISDMKDMLPKALSDYRR